MTYAKCKNIIGEKIKTFYKQAKNASFKGDKMENRAWAKTLLEIYRYLETLCNSIDEIVKRTSLSGFGVSLDTKFSAEKIIELTNKKKTLINLKVLVEDGLSKLNDADIKILTLFYIDGVTAKNLSSMYNINIRTFFRRKSIALTKLFEMFKQSGYTANRLSLELQNENWIMNIYKNNLHFLTCKKEPTINYNFILKKAIAELKNFQKQKVAYTF